MSALDREIRLRPGAQHTLLGEASSALAAVSCGWNDEDIARQQRHSIPSSVPTCPQNGAYGLYMS